MYGSTGLPRSSEPPSREPLAMTGQTMHPGNRANGSGGVANAQTSEGAST